MLLFTVGLWYMLVGKEKCERAGLAVPGVLFGHSMTFRGAKCSLEHFGLVKRHHWMPLDEGLPSTFREVPNKTPGTARPGFLRAH